MVADQPLYPLNLSTSEALTPLEPDRFQPELRTGFLALDVHMGRLVPVRRVKEKTIWSCSKNCWQLSQFTAPTRKERWRGCARLRNEGAVEVHAGRTNLNVPDTYSRRASVGRTPWSAADAPVGQPALDQRYSLASLANPARTGFSSM